MKNLINGLFFLAILFLAVFFLPISKINWGKIENLPAQTITVLGEAKTQEKNQVATFTAGVNAVNDSKEEAIKEVNEKISKIITAVRDFGVTSKDIKTQNLSIYQDEETYYEEGKQKRRFGQWRVSNSIEIRLTNVEKADRLAEILTSSGANNVWGPNFSLEDTKIAEVSLLKEAIENAKEKGQEIAKSTNRKLGKILSVNETGYSQPIYRAEGLGTGGGGMEPGVSTISKQVVVVFELK